MESNGIFLKKYFGGLEGYPHDWDIVVKTILDLLKSDIGQQALKSKNFKPLFEEIEVIVDENGTNNSYVLAPVLDIILTKFYGIDMLKKYAEMTYLPPYVFFGRSDMKELVIPKGVKYFANYSLMRNIGLTKLTFQDGCKIDTFGYRSLSLWGNKNLTTFEISVTSDINTNQTIRLEFDPIHYLIKTLIFSKDSYRVDSLSEIGASEEIIYKGSYEEAILSIRNRQTYTLNWNYLWEPILTQSISINPIIKVKFTDKTIPASELKGIMENVKTRKDTEPWIPDVIVR